MSERASVVVIVIAVAFAVIVFELVRRRRLSEKYALLWIGIAAVVVVLGVFSDALGSFAHLTGIAYPPAALFMAAIIVLLLLVLHLYTVTSRQRADVTRLLQEVAILRERIGEAGEGRRGDGPPDAPQPPR